MKGGQDKRFFSYGQITIDYTLFFSDRKTMEIAVHPDSSVVVKAPTNSGLSLIEKKLTKRARWIIRQIIYFKQFTPKTPDRFYISGETHLYLGKQYRLKLGQGDKRHVKLYRGFFQITCREAPTPEQAKQLLNKWYSEKAHVQFTESFNRIWPKFKRFTPSKPKIFVKRMKKRWGSLSDTGTVTLNTNLVKAPKECIDYVVTHELCHLKFRDHSPEFYKLLETVIPAWEKVKHKLELSMS